MRTQTHQCLVRPELVPGLPHHPDADVADLVVVLGQRLHVAPVALDAVARGAALGRLLKAAAPVRGTWEQITLFDWQREILCSKPNLT